mgnify:CR=1 FL=1
MVGPSLVTILLPSAILAKVVSLYLDAYPLKGSGLGTQLIRYVSEGFKPLIPNSGTSPRLVDFPKPLFASTNTLI